MEYVSQLKREGAPLRLFVCFSHTFYFPSTALIICSFIASALGKLESLHHLLTRSILLPASTI